LQPEQRQPECFASWLVCDQFIRALPISIVGRDKITSE
jgi:hypothetical protein